MGSSGVTPWFQSNETQSQYASGQSALSSASKLGGQTLYVIAGALLVAMLAVSAPRLGVPLLILVALIMLVRANQKAKG